MVVTPVAINTRIRPGKWATPGDEVSAAWLWMRTSRPTEGANRAWRDESREHRFALRAQHGRGRRGRGQSLQGARRFAGEGAGGGRFLRTVQRALMWIVGTGDACKRCGTGREQTARVSHSLRFAFPGLWAYHRKQALAYQSCI